MKSKYKTKSKDVQKFMVSIEKYLTNKYGSVSEEWYCTLFLLADNFDLYFQCREQIVKDGIFDSVNYKKNPLLSTIKDLQATIIKQMQKLGLTPYDESKIGSLNQEGGDADLLKNLMGTDEE